MAILPSLRLYYRSETVRTAVTPCSCRALRLRSYENYTMEKGNYIVEALLRMTREGMICERHVDDCKRDLVSQLCMDIFGILIKDDLPY